MGAVAKSPKHLVGSQHPESKFFLVPAMLEKMAEGMTRTAACRVVGLNPEVVSEWVWKGKKWPEKYPEYAQLLEDLETAKALMQQKMVGLISHAAESDEKHWTAAAWLLERTDPENWGKREKVEVKNEGGPVIQFNQVVLSDPDAREASRELLNRLAAGRSSEPLRLGAGSESAGDGGGDRPEDIDVDPR